MGGGNVGRNEEREATKEINAIVRGNEDNHRSLTNNSKGFFTLMDKETNFEDIGRAAVDQLLSVQDIETIINTYLRTEGDLTGNKVAHYVNQKSDEEIHDETGLDNNTILDIRRFKRKKEYQPYLTESLGVWHK
jgi:hypothetical protein